MPIANFNTYLSSYSGISELIKNHTCDEIIAYTTSMSNLTEEAFRNYRWEVILKDKQQDIISL